MTPKERVAMQQALEALEMYRPLSLPIKLLAQDKTREEAIIALREALAEQAEQEPVAWLHPVHRRAIHAYDLEQQPEWVQADWKKGTPLYAAPVCTKDLTDDEIAAHWFLDGAYPRPLDFARAVIAADREKNK